ncbi:hypothetical protein ID866_2069 [Astraeus odoratus]|nr:hypothetical protein ID866_2069 [Astraeus odoratus]
MSVLVVAKFPSVAAIFMAFAASVLLLLLARIVLSFMRLWSCPLARSEDQEKMSMFSLSLLPKLRTPSSQWNPSLPFALRAPEKILPQTASSVAAPPKRSPSLPIRRWQLRMPSPQFQPPAPALYESPVPLSMAKLIMSRHTTENFCVIVKAASLVATNPVTSLPFNSIAHLLISISPPAAFLALKAVRAGNNLYLPYRPPTNNPGH